MRGIREPVAGPPYARPMALIHGRAALHARTRQWDAAQAQAAAVERRAWDLAVAAEHERMGRDKRRAELWQRLDMAVRLHWVASNDSGEPATPANPLWIASRWDLAAWLDPRRFERLGRAHHEGVQL